MDIQLGTFVQTKILPPETSQVTREKQYICKPVEGLRYLFKRQESLTDKVHGK